MVSDVICPKDSLRVKNRIFGTQVIRNKPVPRV